MTRGGRRTEGEKGLLGSFSGVVSPAHRETSGKSFPGDMYGLDWIGKGLPPKYSKLHFEALKMGGGDITVDMIEAGSFLSQHNWPRGLQQLLIDNCALFPFRYIIVDNSGSMISSDGHRIEQTARGPKSVSCSRWSELTESLLFHAELAQVAMAPTEFRLLNGSGPIVLGMRNDDHLSKLKTVLARSPGGGTPLCRHVREVTNCIKARERELIEHGQSAVLIIATDGEASDGDLAAAMKPLKDLPVWVVLRLCTDDSNVVNYWNEIDKQLELQMDILDDLMDEAKEVKSHNAWLTYAEPLHRLREWGVHLKELDFIDERRLSVDEMRKLLDVMLPPSDQSLPHPEADWPLFESAVAERFSGVMDVLDLATMRYTKLINFSKLRHCYGPKKNNMEFWALLILCVVIAISAITMGTFDRNATVQTSRR